jgi:hypothetical protein
MFEPSSRYHGIEERELKTPGGRVITYKRRRLLPPGESLPVLSEVPVKQGDRLDLIAARTLGDPEQFWRICDANDVLDPLELTDVPWRRIRIPLPQP